MRPHRGDPPHQGFECFAVVDIGRRDRAGQRQPLIVAQQVELGPAFATISGVWPRAFPLSLPGSTGSRQWRGISPAGHVCLARPEWCSGSWATGPFGSRSGTSGARWPGRCRTSRQLFPRNSLKLGRTTRWSTSRVGRRGGGRSWVVEAVAARRSPRARRATHHSQHVIMPGPELPCRTFEMSSKSPIHKPPGPAEEPDRWPGAREVTTHRPLNQPYDSMINYPGRHKSVDFPFQVQVLAHRTFDPIDCQP